MYYVRPFFISLYIRVYTYILFNEVNIATFNIRTFVSINPYFYLKKESCFIIGKKKIIFHFDCCVDIKKKMSIAYAIASRYLTIDCVILCHIRYIYMIAHAIISTH